MRSTILAALTVTTLAVLSACGGEAPPPEAPPPPPPPPPPVASAPPPADTTPPPPPPKPALSDLIPAALKSMGDAFNAHDAQKMTQLFTDDAAVYTYGAGETHSKGDLTTGMQTMFTAFPDAKSALTRQWIAGNVAIIEIVWTGTMSGDMGPFKATNKPVGSQRLHIMWFNDDGMIKEMHEYGDDGTVMAQAQAKKGAPAIPTLPTNPPESHTAKGTPDEDKLVAWAKAGDDAFNKDDVKAVMATMADDADYWLNIGGGPAMKGKKDLEKGLKSWFTAFPDQKWTPTNVWGVDGFAIIEHTVTGTNKGPMGPFPASKKPVQNWHWVDIMQPTADGKVQHGWGYANMVEELAQTGQLPKPPAPPAAGKSAPPAGKGPAPKK
jgi:steroid delta-isomerase-like uncharacterized protein